MVNHYKIIKCSSLRLCICIENGPCPLVAICNVLFLRGDLKIEPEDRELVSFEYLVERLGDYLLNHINVKHKRIDDCIIKKKKKEITF